MIGTAIGIDIGGTNIRAARVSADGTILARARVASSPEPPIVLERIESLVEQMLDDSVRGIGVGVPGQVDFTTQRVLSGGYVDLSNVSVRDRIASRFALPVVIDNDCSMALFGETVCGAATGLRDVAMLTIGTGIGGAIFAGGNPFRGSGVAGQLGHIVVDPAGLSCKCGRRGCVETMSSGSALGRHIAEAGLPAATTAAELLARREAGDQVADTVLRAWALPLRAAVNSIAATIAPEAVLIGGGLGREAHAAMSAYPDPSSWFSYKVVPAALGDDAGVIGAALASMATAAGNGKRLVMVNGVPGSGKSSIAATLSHATGWPLLSLDTVKNPFLQELDNVDRPFNRKLGRASLRAMFSILTEAPEGTTIIMDAWFGFQPRETVQAMIDGAGIDGIAEIWCHAPPEVLGQRYLARVATRLPGHPGAEYVPELMKLAAQVGPSAFGPVHSVDTTQPFDLSAARKFIGETFAA